ncbi:hypothetical protein GQ54DRAFT_295943 [Martensiomyces pterosporus]|nr:hypothetical protein GQ54DRAFT_295943 [Martensiomyces pterosporus]
MFAQLIATRSTASARMLAQLQQQSRFARSLSTTITPRSAADATKAADQPKRAPSIATHGTVLKGLNIYKDGKDPVALKDEEYPDWLWTLLDEVPEESMDERARQRHQRSRAIKESNFMKSKKK